MGECGGEVRSDVFLALRDGARRRVISYPLFSEPSKRRDSVEELKRGSKKENAERRMKKAGKLFEQRERAKGTGPPKKAQPYAVRSKTIREQARDPAFRCNYWIS